jgi:saccharopine dehydrogenase (NAD+, L-lysine-forming)
MRFWMTLSYRYLAYLSVYRDLGLTRIDAVDYEGHPVVALKFLRELLPEAGALGQNDKGRTSIACIMRGGHKAHVKQFNPDPFLAAAWN